MECLTNLDAIQRAPVWSQLLEKCNARTIAERIPPDLVKPKFGKKVVSLSMQITYFIYPVLPAALLNGSSFSPAGFGLIHSPYCEYRQHLRPPFVY
jgi:hypothetical protein